MSHDGFNKNCSYAHLQYMICELLYLQVASHNKLIFFKKNNIQTTTRLPFTKRLHHRPHHHPPSPSPLERRQRSSRHKGSGRSGGSNGCRGHCQDTKKRGVEGQSLPNMIWMDDVGWTNDESFDDFFCFAMQQTSIFGSRSLEIFHSRDSHELFTWRTLTSSYQRSKSQPIFPDRFLSAPSLHIFILFISSLHELSTQI